MPSLSTYHLSWVSLTLDIGYLFMAAPAKHSCSPDIGRGVAPLGCSCLVPATTPVPPVQLWALGSIAANKASGGDGIPAELFQILKDDAVKVLHSLCQQIWKTQHWPQDW